MGISERLKRALRRVYPEMPGEADAVEFNYNLLPPLADCLQPEIAEAFFKQFDEGGGGQVLHRSFDLARMDLTSLSLTYMPRDCEPIEIVSSGRNHSPEFKDFLIRSIGLIFDPGQEIPDKARTKPGMTLDYIEGFALSGATVFLWVTHILMRDCAQYIQSQWLPPNDWDTDGGWRISTIHYKLDVDPKAVDNSLILVEQGLKLWGRYRESPKLRAGGLPGGVTQEMFDQYIDITLDRIIANGEKITKTAFVRHCPLKIGKVQNLENYLRPNPKERWEHICRLYHDKLLALSSPPDVR
jgi:hypothetical protein